MDYVEKNYSQIKEITGEGITFTDGQSIAFGDCIKRRYDSEKCVAERNICAKPPYFEFFTPGKPVRIVFKKNGLFSGSRSNKYFLKLQKAITDSGYSSYDLSCK